ncbi:MAG: hypothetical protein OJF50_000659 [Nitrospira sp.]|jgi:uncharacterized protein YjbI with pentapeptide repeats|nr:hypothetical protein [Nitrospira sp.]
MSPQFDAKAAAVNSASTTARHAHLTLLAFIVYAAITVWSTTDEQLLRGSEVKLPLLDVAVSIVGFYALAPWLLFLLHLNLLLYVMLLSSRVRALEETVLACLNPVKRQGELLRLDAFSITQWLSGEDEETITRTTARIVSFVSIYMTPVAMLLWLQVGFLPFHKSFITHSQTWAICLDLFLLWLFWWEVRRRTNVYKFQYVFRFFMGIMTLCIVFFSIEIAVAPRIPSWWVETNESVSSWLGVWPDRAVRSLPRALQAPRKTLVAEAPSQQVLAAYYQRGEPIDSAWLQQAQGLDLTRRDLRYTNFELSRLWKADFRQSILDGVIFSGAELRGALFTTRENISGTGTSFIAAQLPESELTTVYYPEVDLLQAIMDFSDLTKATFPGSDMRGAKQRGSRVRFGDLRGASLVRISALGADFIAADLRGADLRGANLQCADLNGAQLQGADLRGAMLQGANLSQAKMQAADLRQAKVFATDFSKSDLTLADLRGVTVSDPIADKDPLVRPYTAGGVYRFQQFRDRMKSCPMSRAKTPLLNDAQHADTLFDKDGPFKTWGDSTPSRRNEDRVVSLLVTFACDDRYIANGLLWQQEDEPHFLSGTRLGRTGIFESLDADPILLRRASGLIEGLEKSKCGVLKEIPTTDLQGLKTFLKKRQYLTH